MWNELLISPNPFNLITTCLHICINAYTDGVVRARGWLKGQVMVSFAVTSAAEQQQLSPPSVIPCLTVGELQVNLVGQELAEIPPHGGGGVLCGLRNLASHCTPGGTNSKNRRCKVTEMVIFDEHRVLHDFAQKPVKGGIAMTYPFSIYLPGTLPPSMAFEDKKSGGACSVQYQLTAKIAVAHPPEKLVSLTSAVWGESEVSAAHPLCIVGETLSSKTYPHVLKPTYYPLKQGTLGSGCVAVSARVYNTHVGKGSALDFSLTCRNQSHNTNIQRVDVELLEEIQWKASVSATVSTTYGEPQVVNADHHTMSRTSTLASIKDLNLKDLQKDSIESSLANDTSPLVTELPEVDEITMAEVHNCLLSERNQFQLKVPSTARDSYIGKLIRISHYLQIFLVVRDKPGSDSVIKIPIKVFDPPLGGGSEHLHLPLRLDVSTLAVAQWQDGAKVIDHHHAPAEAADGGLL